MLVREPSHWYPDSLLHQSKGRPQLQPVLWWTRAQVHYQPVQIDMDKWSIRTTRDKAYKRETSVQAYISVCLYVEIFQTHYNSHFNLMKITE